MKTLQEFAQTIASGIPTASYFSVEAQLQGHAGQLSYSDVKYRAYCNPEGGNGFSGDGKTPEEAIENLLQKMSPKEVVIQNDMVIAEVEVV